VFRERLLKKYQNLAAINQAWGTAFPSLEAVTPPQRPVTSQAWVDFQEHRVWAQLDFAAFVTQTLHAYDPNHLVVWSLPFWGSPVCAANWWSWPGSTDILMRHGIDFGGGAHRMAIPRDVAESSGKSANALCMPPDYNPDYVQMMFQLAAGRSGLSHVCIGGTPDHTYYQGAANSTLGWKRKEPIYTASRNLNQLVRTLGRTFLLSKQRPPQVGVYQSEKTLDLNGIENRKINGIFLLLEDLNVDYRVFSESGIHRISEFPVVIIGPFARCFSEPEAQGFRNYVEKGGHLIFVRGAAEADGRNVTVGSPGFGLEELVGSKQAADMGGVKLLKGSSGEDFPVMLAVSTREVQPDVEIVAQTTDGKPVVTERNAGKGRVLYVGADLGSIYQSSWTQDFAGIDRTDSQVIDDNAFGSWFRPDTAGRQAVALQGHRTWAQLVSRFLRDAGAYSSVTMQGVTDAIGAVRAKSFRQGNDYWVGFANRVVQKGMDHKSSPPDQYHILISNLRCTVRVDADVKPTAAYILPMNRLSGEQQTAMPEPLALTAGANAVSLTLPRLEGIAAVLLTNEYEPLVGISADHYHVLPGEVVRLKGRIINTTRRPFDATLSADAAAPLAVVEKPFKVSLRPGAAQEVSFSAAVPPDAAPGHLLVQIVAERPGAQPRVSPSLELEVQSAVEIDVLNADRTIMPATDRDHSLRISGICRVRPDDFDLTVEVKTPEEFSATPRQFKLKADASGSIAAEAELKDEGGASRVAEGEVTIQGTVRGLPFQKKLPIRLARGTVAYEEFLAVKSHSSGVEGGKTRLIALENEKIKANFIPGAGVLYDLVLRETNNDVLVKGEYPYGFVLYAWGGWLGGGFAQVRREARRDRARIKDSRRKARYHEGDA